MKKMVEVEYVGIEDIMLLDEIVIARLVFGEFLDGVGGVGMEDGEVLHHIEVLLEGGEDAATALDGIVGIVGGDIRRYRFRGNSEKTANPRVFG